MEIKIKPDWCDTKMRRQLSQEEILYILDRVREQWKRPPIESLAMAFARAIERAHGIN